MIVYVDLNIKKSLNVGDYHSWREVLLEDTKFNKFTNSFLEKNRQKLIDEILEDIQINSCFFKYRKLSNLKDSFL